MWWLCYQRSGRPYCVVIVEGSSLPAARMRATFDGLGAGGIFSEGHRLDAHCASVLTPTDIGRMLSPQEAAALLDRFDGEQKKPPAPSLKRRAQAERAKRWWFRTQIGTATSSIDQIAFWRRTRGRNGAPDPS